MITSTYIDELGFESQFLDPPDFYGIVTEKIFRCGDISPKNFSFLSLYKFKTVVFVGEDAPHQIITDFLKSREASITRIQISKKNSNISWRTQLDELVKLTLQFILNEDNLPVLISSSNELTVCTIVGCLRKLQGWNIASIFNEFRRYSPEVGFAQNTNYVELFDFDLVSIPSNCFLNKD